MTSSPDLDLVADIGGTNTRVALARGIEVQRDSVRRYSNAGVSGLDTNLARYMDEMQPKDSHMMMLVQALLDAIPLHERQALFRTTSEFIRSRRQHT